MQRVLFLVVAMVVMVIAALRINQPNHQRANMVYVEDQLYVSSGQAMPAEIDPSAILGTIQTSTDPSENPDQNGEANFDCVGAPYAKIKNGLGGRDGLAVLLENEWVFFEPHN